MTKRIMSVLLILCVLLGNLPQWTVPSSAVANGFGDDLLWDFAEETGVLTITGTGNMPDWTYGSYTPWAAHRSDIKAVEIDSGVTSVGDYAFDGCNNLTTVSIGVDVKTIGKNAFRYCYALTEVTIPRSVTEIKECAFYFCEGLKTVTIGKGLTTLGVSVFSACDALEEYRVDADNEVYSSDDHGVLFNKDKTVLIHCPDAYSGTYAIPEGVERLEDRAFSSCSGLTGVTIPEGITTISSFAFAWSGLTEVKIPQGVTTIETCAFFNCPDIKYVELPDTLQEVGEEAFYLCRELTEITIPKGVTAIGKCAFAECINMTTFRIDPENEYYSTDEYGVLFDKDKTVLMQFSATYAGEYVMPEGITVIEERAFSLATDLTAVTIADTVTEIRDEAFAECSGLTSIVLPDGLMYLGEGAFRRCDRLASVWIGEGLTRLERSVFEACWALSTVVFPKSMTEIGYDAFYDCESLQRVVVLNPDCDLSYSDDTFSLVPEGIVCGHPDSTAELYAQERGYTFYELCQCEDYACDYSGRHVEASCTEDGGIRYTCRICGYAYLVPEVPAMGHSYSDVVTPPSCTEGGYTTYFCDVCGDSYTDDIVEATGHSYVPTVTPPTCTEDGITVYNCSVCGATYADPPVGATGHHYSPTVTPPTCTAEGYTTHICTVCGDSYTDSAVAANGHSYNAVVTAPTCTAEGYTTHTCKVCGDTYADSVVPATGHNYTDVLTAPTCTEAGYTTYTCTTCGDTYTDSAVEALGHKYTSAEKAPTCTEAGGIVHTCLVCGDTYIEDPIAPNGHDLTMVVTPPTCEKEGYTTYDCTVCGETYIGEKVPALGHTLGDRSYVDPMNHEGFCSVCEQMVVERHTAANALCLCGVYAGTCGAKLVWVLQPETGLLTVAGTGDMTSWFSASKTPWYAYRASIKAVEITSGVTSVGNYAFNGFTSVSTVTTGGTVTTVGSYAFENCTGLTDLTLSASALGTHAFKDCSSLVRVTLPVDYDISGNPFYGCNQAQELHYTAGITGIMPNRILYSGSEGMPYRYSLEFQSRGTLQKVSFENGITKIGNRAFCGSETDAFSALSNVVLPESLVSIGDYAFYNNKSIVSIKLPDNVKELGSYCFYGCSAIKELQLSPKLTKIPAYCFFGCKGLTKLVLPNTITTIDESAFENCTGLTDLTLSASALGTHAFKDCSSLVRVTLPVDYDISGNPFYGCNQVQEIHYTAGTTGIMPNRTSGSSSESMYYRNSLEYWSRGALQKVIFGNGITKIGSYAFYGSGTDAVATLSSITFPESLISIGTHAFYNNKSIVSIKLPDNVKELGSYCFYDCSAVKELQLSSKLTKIPTNCFFGCKGLTELPLPSTITSIGDYAFQNCTGLTDLTLSASALGKYAFKDCSSLVRVTLPVDYDISGKPFYGCNQVQEIHYTAGITGIMPNRILYSGSEEMPYWYALEFQSRGTLQKVSFENGITKIGNCVFYGSGTDAFATLSSITFPESLVSIGDYAFYNNKSVVSIKLPDNVKELGSYCFYGCSAMKELPLSSTLSKIPAYCFYGCKGLTKLVLPNTMTSIDESAFENCTGLTELVIPENITSVESYAFQNCTGLTDLTVSASELGHNAFANCTGLLRVTVPVDYTVGNHPFSGCSKVQEIRFTSGNTGIMLDCTYNNHNNTLGYVASGSLQKVTFDEGVTHIGNYVFYNNADTTSTLAEVVFPKTLESIGIYAFCYNKSISSISLPDSLKTLGAYCFRGCSGIKTIRFSSALTKISDYCFYGCSGLTKVSIPSRVTSIGSYAFRDCSGLSKVTIPDSVTSLGSCAFANCTELKRATVGSGVGSISSAFSGCSSLTRITIEHPKCSISGYMGPKDYMVVYGYDESTAQSYAKKYGYTFVSIGSSAGWSAPESSVEKDTVYEQNTNELTLTIYVNRWDADFIIPNYQLADTATVEYKGKTYSLYSWEKGQITFPYDGGSVTVSKDGYVTRTLAEAALRCSQSVYLQKRETSIPVLNALWLKSDESMINILEDDFHTLSDSGSTVVIPEIDWGDSSYGSIALYQGSNKVPLTEGENTVYWSRVLDLSEDIYLVATNANGKTMKQKVKIKLLTPLGDFKFAVGDKMSAKLPGEASVFGGKELSIGLPTTLAVDYYMENGKAYLSIGARFNYDWNSENGKLEREKFWTECKNLCKLPKNAAQEYLKNVDLKKFLHKEKGSIGFEHDFMIGGFVEAYVKPNGGLEMLDGGIIILAETEHSEAFPFYVWVLPCFVDVKLGSSVEAKGILGVNNEYKEITPDFELKTEITADGRVGLGAKKFLNVSGGLEGKFNIDWDIKLGETDYFRLGATLKAYFKAELMGLSYKNPSEPLVDQTWLELPLRKGPADYAWDGCLPELYDPSSYSVSDLSYLEQPSQFMPEDKSAQRTTTGDMAVTDFLTNAYSDAETQIVAFPDGTRLALWIGTDGSSDINDLQLYASYYDTENWSDPIAVDPDGTMDGEVSVIATADGAYMVWQDLADKIPETATLEDIASIIGISFAHFDKKTEEFTVRRLTDKVDSLNMMPTLCETADGVCVVWVNNGDSLWFGNDETNHILCRRLRKGEWGETEILYADLRSVESLSVAEVEGELQVAYCVDTDGDWNTTEDTEAYLNGQLLDENAVMDSGVTIAGKTLYWYRDGMIVDGSGAEIVKLVTDRFSVVDENGVKAILYNRYNGLYSAIYGVFYDWETESWGEPIALTSMDGSYNDFSAFVDEGGKINLFVNRVEVVGDYTSEDPYGEATLQLMTQTLSCDLAITGMYYDCSTYVAGRDMVFDLSVTNRGALAANGLVVRMVDDTGAVLLENLYLDTILPGEITNITCGFTAKTVIYGKKITITVAPYDEDDLNLADNSKTADLKFDDVAVEHVGYGVVEDGSGVIYADVVNRSYIPRDIPLTVQLHEGGVNGQIIDRVSIDTMEAMTSVRVSFTGDLSSDTLYYVVIETEGANDNLGNDSDYLVTPADTCPHAYVYTDNGENHTVLCELCGNNYTKAHNYFGGACACGAKETIVDESIQIYHTLDLASDISVTFAVPKTALTSYDSYYLECVLPEYTGNTQTGTSTVKVDPVDKGSYYYFTLTGITAIRMGDMVDAVLHMTKGTQTYISKTDSYSVATYAYGMLNSTTDTKMLTLCANLLRYGAEAQSFKKYRTDSLVDATMTETHRSYLSNTDTLTFTATDSFLGDLENAPITWVGKTLDLGSKVGMKFVFNAKNYSGNIANLSMKVSYQGSNGETKTVTLTGAEVYNAANGYYSFTFYGLLASELRTVVDVAICEGETRLSETLRYSAESYASKNTTGTLAPLCKALFAYSDSANAFFAK